MATAPSRARRDAPIATLEPPRLAILWAAALYALCTLALMYPALSGQFLVNPSSDMLSSYAYRQFGGSFMRETGGFAQWNPFIVGGLPFIAGQHGDMFYPTFILRELLRQDVATNFSFGLHLFLCGLFAYAFLRAWGVRFHGALVGGLAYMLAGQVATLVSAGHDGKLYVSAITPLVLWMIVLGMRDGRRWAWGVLAMATGFSILSPHFQMTYYLGLLAGAFTIFLAFYRGEWTLDPRTRYTRLAWATGGALLGLAIAAVHFAPFLAYIPFSPRQGGGRGYEYATSWSIPPEELLSIYLPQFSGMLENYWGRNPFKLFVEYIGAAALVLASGAFAAVERRRFLWFWGGAAIVATLVAVGGHTPFYRLWYLLPMMKVVRAPGMVFFVTSFAIAVFVAVGTERVLTRGVSRRFLAGWGIAAAVIALLATGGVLQAIGSSIAPAEKYELVRLNSSAVIAGAWRSFAFVALALGVLYAVSERRIAPAVAGFALAVIVAVDNLSVVRAFYRFSPPAPQLYGSDPTIEYLRALKEPGRVISLPLERLEAPGDPILNGDALMIHRVRAVTGHQGNELQTWVQLAGAKSPAPPVNIVLPQFRRLANVKYWLTNAELPAEIPAQPLAMALGGEQFARAVQGTPAMRLTKRVGPVRNAVGNTVYLYELQEDNPYAWVATVIVKAPPEAIFATVLDPRFDAGTAALFDTAAPVTGVQVTTLPQPLGIRVATSRLEPGRISLELASAAPAGSALVVSENYYPGWTATVDGKPAAIGRADYSLIGVALPAGARRVELLFADRDYPKGKAITLVALTAAMLLIAWGIVAERKRRVPVA